MRYLLFGAGVLSGLWGVLVMLVAKTALQEIQGSIALLTAAVLISGAGICEAVVKLRVAVTAQRPPG